MKMRGCLGSETWRRNIAIVWYVRQFSKQHGAMKKHFHGDAVARESLSAAHRDGAAQPAARAEVPPLVADSWNLRADDRLKIGGVMRYAVCNADLDRDGTEATLVGTMEGALVIVRHGERCPVLRVDEFVTVSVVLAVALGEQLFVVVVNLEGTCAVFESREVCDAARRPAETIIPPNCVCAASEPGRVFFGSLDRRVSVYSLTAERELLLHSTIFLEAQVYSLAFTLLNARPLLLVGTSAFVCLLQVDETTLGRLMDLNVDKVDPKNLGPETGMMWCSANWAAGTPALGQAATPLGGSMRPGSGADVDLLPSGGAPRGAIVAVHAVEHGGWVHFAAANEDGRVSLYSLSDGASANASTAPPGADGDAAEAVQLMWSVQVAPTLLPLVHVSYRRGEPCVMTAATSGRVTLIDASRRVLECNVAAAGVLAVAPLGSSAANVPAPETTLPVVCVTLSEVLQCDIPCGLFDNGVFPSAAALQAASSSQGSSGIVSPAHRDDDAAPAGKRTTFSLAVKNSEVLHQLGRRASDMSQSDTSIGATLGSSARIGASASMGRSGGGGGGDAGDDLLIDTENNAAHRELVARVQAQPGFRGGEPEARAWLVEFCLYGWCTPQWDALEEYEI
jgi:hypothetical protein